MQLVHCGDDDQLFFSHLSPCTVQWNSAGLRWRWASYQRDCWPTRACGQNSLPQNEREPEASQHQWSDRWSEGSSNPAAPPQDPKELPCPHRPASLHPLRWSVLKRAKEEHWVTMRTAGEHREQHMQKEQHNYIEQAIKPEQLVHIEKLIHREQQICCKLNIYTDELIYRGTTLLKRNITFTVNSTPRWNR